MYSRRHWLASLCVIVTCRLPVLLGKTPCTGLGSIGSTTPGSPSLGLPSFRERFATGRPPQHRQLGRNPTNRAAQRLPATLAPRCGGSPLPNVWMHIVTGRAPNHFPRLLHLPRAGRRSIMQGSTKIVARSQSQEHILSILPSCLPSPFMYRGSAQARPPHDQQPSADVMGSTPVACRFVFGRR